MKKNNKKGFTIVELVIVIAVIGILSAILIPTFIGLTNNAKEVKLQADLNGAWKEFRVENPTVEIEQNEIIFATADINDDNATVTIYMFDQANAENKWSAVAQETTGDYVQVGTETYNGYYAFTYTPAD